MIRIETVQKAFLNQSHRKEEMLKHKWPLPPSGSNCLRFHTVFCGEFAKIVPLPSRSIIGHVRCSRWTKFIGKKSEDFLLISSFFTQTYIVNRGVSGASVLLYSEAGIVGIWGMRTLFDLLTNRSTRSFRNFLPDETYRKKLIPKFVVCAFSPTWTNRM